MEEEVDEVVGPKGRHDPDRTAVRHGHGWGGDARRPARRGQRPRMRTADGEPSCRSDLPDFADRDPLTRVVMEQMLAGVSTRRFERTREPVGAKVEAEARSVSKSAVCREFVERTRATWRS